MQFQSQAAIYLQIADYIMENILRLRLKPGDRVPSIRELAVDVEVNPNTVTRTYGWLQEKGIIINRRGLGYFVATDGLAGSRRLKMTEFVEHDIPALSKTMELMGLEAKDLEAHLMRYREKQGVQR
jgi:GntR family transcriptional regulator